MANLKTLRKYHQANLNQIESAIEHIASATRKSIARGDNDSTLVFVRLLALLLGVWGECRLLKLLSEDTISLQKSRDSILKKKQQLGKWKALLEVAFRQQYKVPRASLSEETLDHSTYSRYKTLTELLENDLKPIIELRNKFAHGQWAYTLNANNTDISSKSMKAIKSENLLSLNFKRKLLKALSDAIHDLVVSKPTFERDFNTHYKKIVDTRRNLRTRKYSDYERVLQIKFQRGIGNRAAMKSSTKLPNIAST